MIKNNLLHLNLQFFASKRKEYLLNRKAKLEERKATLKSKVDSSEDVNEVRSLTEDLSDVIDELNYIKGELADLEGVEEKTTEKTTEEKTEERSANVLPQTAHKVNGNLLAKFNTSSNEMVKRNDDIYASYEYRKAFMQYAQSGIAIPKEYAKRDNVANTDSLGATIPTTVLNEFINEIKVRYGQLYSKTRKLNIKGMLKVPIARLQASFKWVSESTVAPRENGGEYDKYVEFSYNTAEIRVAQTLLSNIVTLDLFEREIVNVMMIAYLKAMDEGIVKGTGNGQMLGILNDPRITNSTNIVEFTENEINDWTEWRKKFFAKLPLGYRSGEFIFPLSTVEAYLETMADNNNNPIFRQATGLEVRDGDATSPNGRFFGRNIALVEPDILPDFYSANNGDVIGIYWQPEEYAINTNMEFMMRRYFDEERNEWVNKILTIVDGKVLNPCGYWLIKKKVTG